MKGVTIALRPVWIFLELQMIKEVEVIIQKGWRKRLDAKFHGT
jgi:hypothetical protein